jgi:tetratricopeptide (TPR) repeat protein
MAGNKTVFQDALRKAHNFAWDRKWSQAIVEYRRALVEIDNDPQVWIGLGTALVEVRRWPDARDAYQHATDLQPDNLALPVKLAEIYERLGNIEAALQTYLNLATLLEKSSLPVKAVEPWQAILRLQPLHLDSRQHLADLLEQLQRNQEAARENAILARLLRERGREQEAEGRARKALHLDPHNAAARAFVAGLQPAARDSAVLASLPVRPNVETNSPAQRARQKALKRLGESTVEKAAQSPGIPKEALSQLARATEALSQSRPGDAVEALQNAIAAGVGLVEAQYVLGMLYLDSLNTASAIAAFNQCVRDREYALGSHFALGVCYGARGELDGAVAHILEAVRAIDAGLLAPEKTGRLSDTYKILARRYGSNDAGDAAQFVDALVEYFRGKNWPEQVIALRRKLDSVSVDGELLPLAEVIGTRCGEAVIDALATSQEHLKRARHTAALDECYRGIALAPNYIPLHWELANIFTAQGRTEAAVEKYATMASLFRARAETPQVLESYRRTLKIEPANQAIRAKLIEELQTRREFAEAIDQYFAAGQVYGNEQQTDRALASFQAALRLIPQAGRDRWTATILHAMGEIYVQRAAWAEALAIYAQVRKLAPDDEKASLRLMDLYFKLNRETDSQRELAHLIELYSKSGDISRLIPVVSDMSAAKPKNTTLRQTLVELLIDSGRKDEAVAELDAIGDIQMNTGQTREAVQTIERIISLGPENVEEYRTLLGQMQKAT